ncbi:homogentisate 1,2-dioxygenase [Sphingobium nicotianae]|uniref:Homogentisate 1,2-dioxygenase n=1 Tax=Sphingobium nicotianae TaxID=2782607 RepID=A0A9X1DDC1_9SPHN|nr:homogentisate 1,2-dioxygenase [Sphingobium nicotianae]MBT2187824.1 homogentisate 1,2-dioxygenase [Sphingobium nicotianae]
MRKRLTFLALPLLAAASAPALAQQMAEPSGAACPASSAALPPELASWKTPNALTAATDGAAASAAGLEIGQAVDLALAPTPSVTYALRPERPGGSVSSGGVAAFHVVKAGVYRVAIDSAAWLDVVSDGKSLESISHGHGPDCSGVRKMVDFRLDPGVYVLQIVGNGSPRIRVLVTTASR